MSEAGVIWLVVLAVSGFASWRLTATPSDDKGGRVFGGVGSAAVGVFYDMLNEDKRNAVEIIVEEKAGARDPEDRDGNLPDLQEPRG